MAGVQAASEAALLLDFLGHVCCGVSRRRPLPGKRGQKSRQGGGSLRISSAKLRVRFVCVRRPQRQAFAFLASVPGISEHAVKLTARLATLTATLLTPNSHGWLLPECIQVPALTLLCSFLLLRRGLHLRTSPSQSVASSL